MFKLASLIVEIVAETSSLDRALSRTHANLSTANIALGTFAGNIAASFARMAVGAAGGLFEATIRSASHLGETVNRVKVVLGDSADKVIKDADVMADRYGSVKSEVLNAVSSFSLLGREMKLSEAGSADLGIKLTRMASELTSFFDPKGDLAGMMHKLESGLAGQVRPLRELGIFMTADAVKAEAARMGLKPGASGQLSEGDKIRARISFIENSKAMQLATGDLERTLDSTENQTRKFWGTLSNLGTSVGQELDPAWNKLIHDFNSGLDQLKDYFNDNKSTVRSWGDSVVEGFETAAVVWRNMPDTLKIALLGAQQNMEDARASIEQWATTVAVYIENAFLKAAQATGDYFQKAQGLGATVDSYLVSGLQGATSAAQSAAAAGSNSFDFWVEQFSISADAAFRPIRDLTNAMERGAGLGDYKQMSVYDDVSRLKGTFGGVSKGIGEFGVYLDAVQDNLGMMAGEKPKDFTSGLIAAGDKHVADTLAENTDISSIGIAAAQARITAREAKHLDDLANKWVEDTEYDKMFPPATRGGPGKGRGAGEEDAAAPGGKTKHHKALEDSASFAADLVAQQLGGDVQEKQLTELQQIREIDQKNADMMERIYNKGARAVYA